MFEIPLEADREKLHLHVCFYKRYGKWYETSDIPITEKKLLELLKHDGYGFASVEEYIRKNQDALISIDSDFFWNVELRGTEEPYTSLFCQFLHLPSWVKLPED